MKLFWIVLLAILATFMFAQNSEWVTWQENGIPVRQGENIEWSRAAAALTNGTVVYTWSDTKRGDRDLWAQLVDADGNKVWGDNPVLVDGKIDRQEDPVVIGTSDGGIIIAWVEFNEQPVYGDIFMQKLSVEGELLWQEGGVPLCTAPNVQISLNIVADQSGGAYIIWIDSRAAGGKDIYGAHVNADGEDIWGENGIALTNETGEPVTHTFWEDGQGGAVLAYVNDNGGKDILAKRILSDGTIDWSVTLSDAVQDQIDVKMCQMSATTYGFAWCDRRIENDGDIFAQSVDVNGNLLWSNSHVVYQGTSVQENPRVTSAVDGTMIVTWEDKRNEGDKTDIYAQKLDASGNLLWDTNGLLICDAEENQLNPRLRPDDDGGCYIVWDDERFGGHNYEDIYIQHVVNDGSVEWASNGIPVCSAALEQYSPLINSAGDNYFICWGDRRDGSIGLYYQVMDSDGDFLLQDNGVMFYWGLEGDASEIIAIEQNDNTVVVWNDARYGVIGERAFMQMISPDGQMLFQDNGISFTEDLETDNVNQASIDIVDYHDGGVVAVWEQEDVAFLRAHAQAMDDEGNRLWGPNGIEISSATLSQRNPHIGRIGSEYYIAWSNLVFDSENFIHVYALYIQKIVDGVRQWGDEGIQFLMNGVDCTVDCVYEDYILYHDLDDAYIIRIDSDGNPAAGWPTEGLTLCNVEGIQKNLKAEMTNDGLLVIWEDFRHESSSIYGQLVSPDGTIQWAENGIPIADYENAQYQFELSTNGDDYYFIWSDFRLGNDEDVAMQKMDPAGDIEWGNDALWIAQQDSAQANPAVLAYDDYVMIAWEDWSVMDNDLCMHNLKADGTANWSSYKTLCDAIKWQESPQIVPSGPGHTTVVWSDLRSSGKSYVYGIYAQRVNNNYHGISDDSAPPAAAKLGQNFPNPFNPETTIEFSILNKGNVELGVYNIRGQKVKTLVNESFTAGTHKVVWDGKDERNEGVSSGIYFYRLNAGGKELTRKMVLIK